MRALNFRGLTAVTVTLFLAATARASEPEPQDRNPGSASKLPSLDQTFGLGDSSQPGTGMAGLSAHQVNEYVQSVQSLNVALAFKTDKNRTVDLGDTSHWHVHHWGPLPIPVPNLNPGIQVQGGSEVRLTAGYSKKNGEAVATLDDVKLQAPAVHFGPFGLLSVEDAEIKSDGSMDLKLSRYLPTLHVTQITKDGDGDVHLHVKWFPDVYITPKGDVQIHIGPSWCHYTKTIGHVSVNIFAEWPPKLEDVLALAAAPAAAKSRGMANMLSPATRQAIDSIAGNATFDLNATTKGTPVDLKGVKTTGDAQLSVHGEGRVQNGVFSTVGNNNTASVKLKVGGLDANLANGDSVKLDHANVDVSGHYQLDLPLADPSKHLLVDFAGKAGLDASGKDANLALPSGATVHLANFDGSANGAVSFHDGADGRRFQLDSGSYSLGASGPIQVKKVGPISSLDMDGQLSSHGTVKIGPGGIAQLTGNLDAKGELAQGLPLSFKGVNTSLAKGSSVEVSLDHLDAAVSLPFAVGQSGKPALESATASGKVHLSGAVGDTTVLKNGVAVHSQGAAVNVDLQGTATAKPGSLDAKGHVTGTATLEGPTTVDGRLPDGTRVDTSLASGSSVSLDGTVGKDASGLSADGTIKTNASVGATAISGKGVSVNAPSGTVSLAVTGKTGSSGTTAHIDANAALGQGASVDYQAPGGVKVDTSLTSGTHVGVSGDLAGKTFTGTLNGQVDASGLRAQLGPLVVNVPADARIGISAPFQASASSGGVGLQSAQATVPIHVDLHKGTTLSVTIHGIGASITLDTEGTYLEVTAQAAIVNGKPVIESLDNATINIVLGDVAAAALGHQLGFPVDKRLTFSGNASFAQRSISVHGQVSLGQKGASSSFFTFSW